MDTIAKINYISNSCLILILSEHWKAIRRIKRLRCSGTKFDEAKTSEALLLSNKVQANWKELDYAVKLFLQTCHIEKAIWIKPRTSSFWDNDMNFFLDSDWIANFRMKRDIFCQLIELLYEEMAPNNVFVREPVPVEKRIAIAVYKLASCAEYRTVGNLFGVHKATVRKFLYMFCDAVKKKMFHKLIKMPDIEEAYLLASRGEKQNKLPMAIGFVDGSHIPVLPPQNGRKDFVNRKQYASIVLQAVVDMNLEFRNVSCMVPGSAHDATVLKASSLFKHTSRFMPTGTQRINNNFDLPFFLVGDPAYPLLPWLMKPYIHRHGMGPEQESCNVYFASARTVVEQAFGHLKGRWRILLKRIDLDFNYVPVVIAVCCTLHNFCEKNKSSMPVDTNEVLELYNEVYPQPTNRNSLVEEDSGKRIRDAICEHLKNTAPLRRSFFQ